VSLQLVWLLPTCNLLALERLCDCWHLKDWHPVVWLVGSKISNFVLESRYSISACDETGIGNATVLGFDSASGIPKGPRAAEGPQLGQNS
jgi:hypothetical protein